MKKLLNSLPFRLLLGIVVGVLLGQVFPLGAKCGMKSLRSLLPKFAGQDPSDPYSTNIWR